MQQLTLGKHANSDSGQSESHPAMHANSAAHHASQQSDSDLQTASHLHTGTSPDDQYSHSHTDSAEVAAASTGQHGYDLGEYEEPGYWDYARADADRAAYQRQSYAALAQQHPHTDGTESHTEHSHANAANGEREQVDRPQGDYNEEGHGYGQEYYAQDGNDEGYYDEHAWQQWQQYYLQNGYYWQHTNAEDLQCDGDDWDELGFASSSGEVSEEQLDADLPEKLADRPLCSMFQLGRCTRGSKCPLVHGDLCKVSCNSGIT